MLRTRPAVDRFKVPALLRGLTILELLARHPEGLRMSEIAEALRLPPNSVFRINGQLEESGYLRRDDAGRFRLGTKLFSLGCGALGEERLIEKSLDVMRRLRDETTETVLLGQRLDREGVVLEQLPALHALRFVVDPGSRFPLHSAAPGKAMLAFLPEDERAQVLSKMKYPAFTPRTISSRAAFEQELKHVQKTGHALDEGEEIEGLHCIGAPIFNRHGYPTAALWITAPSNRLPKSLFARNARLVVTAAHEISERLGHFPAATG